MEPFRGGFLVTDGHHNRVLHVGLDGDIIKRMAFDNVVPTGLELQGMTVYMAQAGPAPHLPEDGKVVAFKSHSTSVKRGGRSVLLLVDVEFGRGGKLYALSQGDWRRLPRRSGAAEYRGALVRANANGTFTVVEDGLNQPTSLDFIGNTAYVVNLTGRFLWTIDVAPAVPMTFTVLNLADSGPGSLRQAILEANSASGADVIRFASKCERDHHADRRSVGHFRLPDDQRSGRKQADDQWKRCQPRLLHRGRGRRHDRRTGDDRWPGGHGRRHLQ